MTDGMTFTDSRWAKTLLRVLAGSILALGLWHGEARELPQPAGTKADTTEGRLLFTTYCASCHGLGGIGQGPAAAAMRRPLPDITGLALANGGVFPLERTRRIIDGREIESHGNRDMPVWGDAFKAVPGGHSDATVRARINAIVEYLAAIQRRRA